ncbi:vanadium-dependent haloperoxidase [Pseudonocardia kujensis]|uniref:vanadium-dependent haloperoxidase n=1 Tax=Pseudonocardia kujensis TaxID=1128675 RepID=UPI001E4C64D6|nr:vanadium-dependent haloperoxidase [Pseudonocardia kujensis]MCE0765994.1 vanadium-dependent haloperoxidase [Pseudonocardia kujensis]
MRTRTRSLVILAAAAAAAGIAVPALAATSGGGTSGGAAVLADVPGSGQAVIDWNRQLISILGTPDAQPATVHPTRSFAMLQAAEYDAVVSITHAASPYRAVTPAADDARPDAAADQAAHDVLVALYPSKRAGLDTQLSTELAAMPAGQATQDGVRVGAAAAQQMLELRASDGSSAAAAPFVAGTRPGDYRPTPPKFPAPMYTGWGSVTPFLLDSATQFTPAAPPPVTGPAYATALNQVESLGRDDSTTRTPDQTVAGRFWSASPVWNTWNQVAQTLAADRKASLAQATAAFATLDLSLADTTIALYDAKYREHVWRPVTAIQLGSATGNPAIVADPTWNPLTPTAADPSYPGAHSALSEAAATSLTAFYGPRQAVAITSSAVPGVTRTFTSLAAAADEAGLSRIWAGQHTALDHQAGQQLGRQVAGVVLGGLHLPSTG